MKVIRATSILVLCVLFLLSSTSCVVLTKRDNGRHKGWNKNPNNPHNPNYLDLGSRKANKRK